MSTKENETSVTPPLNSESRHLLVVDVANLPNASSVYVIW